MKVKKILVSLMVSAGLLSSCGVSPDEIYSAASANAKVYAKNAKMLFIDCSSQDSDVPHDGYVSCNLMDEKTEFIMTIECNYRSAGCKKK